MLEQHISKLPRPLHTQVRYEMYINGHDTLLTRLQILLHMS